MSGRWACPAARRVPIVMISFVAWLLAPLQGAAARCVAAWSLRRSLQRGAAARCVAACALGLGRCCCCCCRDPLPDVWPCAPLELGRCCCCCRGAAAVAINLWALKCRSGSMTCGFRGRRGVDFVAGAALCGPGSVDSVAVAVLCGP